MEFELASTAGVHSGGFTNNVREAREYRAFRQYIRSVSQGREPEKAVIVELEQCNSELLEMRAVRPGSVHQDAVIQTMTQMYANEQLIADQVVPTVYTGGELSAKYFAYNKDDRTSYPDDTAADRTDLAELTENRSLSSIALTPRGFKEYVDQLTLQNQDKVLDELMDATENVLYALKFRKEMRTVTTIQTAGNYGGNTTTISSGSSRWDNTLSSGVYTDGDPIGVVQTGIEAIWTGNSATRLIGVISLGVLKVLRKHTQFLERVKYGGSNASPANVTLQVLAEIFGLDQIYVGAARYNSAQEGQTASYGRLWGNHFSILRVASTPARRSASFAYCFQDAATQSDQLWEPQKGVKGAYMCRAAHCDGNVVVAPLAGYHIVSPVA